MRVMCRWSCAPPAHTDEALLAHDKPYIEFFDKFAKTLDDVIVRGAGCDLVFLVARHLHKNAVAPIRSFDWVDSIRPGEGGLRDPDLLEDIKHLSCLTQLHLGFVHKDFPEPCIARLAKAVDGLRGLRQVPLSLQLAVHIYTRIPKQHRLIAVFALLLSLKSISSSQALSLCFVHSTGSSHLRDVLGIDWYPALQKYHCCRW